MKKLFFLLLILPFFGISQSVTNVPANTNYSRALGIPIRDTFMVTPSLHSYAWIVNHNDSIFCWSPLQNKWVLIAIPGGLGSGGSSYSADESTIHLAGTTFSIKSTYVGQSSITTLGTITTGTWQANPIADAYIASASTWNAKQAALVSGTNIKTVNGISLLGSGDASVGTVTSVGITITSQALATSGSPITTWGNINLAWQSDSNHYVLGDGTLAPRWNNYLRMDSLNVTGPLSWNIGSKTLSISKATSSVDGYVGTSDFTNFLSAYNNKITSAVVSGTTTKTLTLFKQDGTQITTAWVDLQGSGSGTGIHSINGDSTLTQTFNTGSSGTDFNIVTNGSGTTTFNIPTASSTNRGLLAASDWSNFNSKQPGNADLTAIAGLSGTGYAKRTGNGTWALDNSTFLTANQTITLSATGDISAFTTGTTTLSTSYVVNGIRNVLIPVLSNGFLKYNSGSWVFDNSTYLTSYTETDPAYTANGVPKTRTLTINGTALDLSANRSWTIPTGAFGTYYFFGDKVYDSLTYFPAYDTTKLGVKSIAVSSGNSLATWNKTITDSTILYNLTINQANFQLSESQITNLTSDLAAKVTAVKVNGTTYNPTSGLVDLGTISGGGFTDAGWSSPVNKKAVIKDTTSGTYYHTDLSVVNMSTFHDQYVVKWDSTNNQFAGQQASFTWLTFPQNNDMLIDSSGYWVNRNSSQIRTVLGTAQLSSISLTTPNVIFATPVNFTNSSGAWSGTLTLNTQTAHKFFGNNTGSSTTPSFVSINEADVTNLTTDLANINQPSSQILVGNGTSSAPTSSNHFVFASDEAKVQNTSGGGRFTIGNVGVSQTLQAMSFLADYSLSLQTVYLQIGRSQDDSTGNFRIDPMQDQSGQIRRIILGAKNVFAEGFLRVGSAVNVSPNSEAWISHTLQVMGDAYVDNLNDATGVAKMVTVNNGVLGYQTIPSGGSGTVTSVGLSVPSSTALSVSGSPVTSSGTLALSWTSDNSHYVLGDGTLATKITNNNQLTNGSNYITLSSLSAGTGISYNNATGVISATAVLPSLSQYHFYTGNGSSVPADAGANLTYDGTTLTANATVYHKTTRFDEFTNSGTGTTTLTIGTIAIDDYSNGVITINVSGYDATTSDFGAYQILIGYKKYAGTLTIGSVQKISSSATGSGSFSGSYPSFSAASNSGNLDLKVFMSNSDSFYWKATYQYTPYVQSF